MYSEEPSLRRLKCTEIKTRQRRQTPTLDVLSIASFIHGVGPITRSRFWLARGEGGDRCNTTTCRMAKDAKDPCICHVDTSHAERPRTESSLLFCNFFYNVKIIEKSLFYEPEIGFIDKITSYRRIRYFIFYFLTLKTF